MAEITAHNDELREQIQSAIAPWSWFDKKPPYTVEQMVAMAVITSRQPIDEEEIFSWILGKFEYYRRMVSRGSLDIYTSSGDDPGIRIFRNDFDATLNSYEIPFKRTKQDGQTYWSLAEAEGRLLFGHAISESDEAKPNTTDIGFFSLPAELRNTIYEMMFQYPRNGLKVIGTPGKSRTLRFKVLSQYPHAEAPYGVAMEFGTTYPSSRILAPLLANKQLHNEARPLFFRNNHFHFAGVNDMYQFLQKLAPARRAHIGHVSFQYSDDHLAGSACKLLAGIEDLQILQIHFIENAWLGRTNRDGQPTKRHQTLNNLPGINSLRSIRGLQSVEFIGPCPHFEAVLKDDMLTPKQEPARKATRKGKKRKVDNVENEQTKDGKAKRSKE